MRCSESSLRSRKQRAMIEVLEVIEVIDRVVRSIVLTSIVLGAGSGCGQGPNTGSENRSIPIDAVTYEDPLCAPNPMTGAACITPLPGGSVMQAAPVIGFGAQ